MSPSNGPGNKEPEVPFPRVIRVQYSTNDWNKLQRVEDRILNAKKAGVVLGYNRHQDAINNVVIFEIRYPR